MNKAIVILSMAVVLMAGYVLAEEQDQPAATEEKVKVDNKICPISGEVIEETADKKPVQVEYKGKMYNLCCEMCVKDFNKDPEKYIKNIEEQMKAEKEGDQGSMTGQGMGQMMGQPMMGNDQGQEPVMEQPMNQMMETK